jgi:Glycosyl hydrolases family 16
MKVASDGDNVVQLRKTYLLIHMAISKLRALSLCLIVLYSWASCTFAQDTQKSPTTSPSASITPFCKDGQLEGYVLKWSDEFDAAELDKTKWIYRTDSKMLSTQKAENVSIANGKLLLHLKKEEAGTTHYTGGGVISKQAFKYGYYEARLKTPPGAGWHTSFWAMKHDGSGGTGVYVAYQELDIIEQNSNIPNCYDVATHRWRQPYKSFGGKVVRGPASLNLSADFHVYGCEFTASTAKYFFDGTLVQTVDVSIIEHNEQNIWLTSIACQTGDKKGVDESKLPSTADFDYVRFFERPEKK